jgi:hypothetical protein
MDVGGFVNYGERERSLSRRLIWLAGAIAVCRGALATFFPTLRSILNL